MPDELAGAAWAFGWGMVAASGILAGAGLGLVIQFGHRTIAAIMSLGAGVLLATASVEVASEALRVIGAAWTAAGILAGAATFSAANALLVGAADRKRCGECRSQPTEVDAPGSGSSIALGTALDAVPEALLLGLSLRTGAPDVVLIAALALSNFPEALSGTVGLRHASRSTLYVLLLWGMIALISAITTAAAFSALGDIGNAASAGLMAYAAGSLIAMVTETMVPEAFHNGPRYSGVLAAAGFAALMMLAGLFS